MSQKVVNWLNAIDEKISSIKSKKLSKVVVDKKSQDPIAQLKKDDAIGLKIQILELLCIELEGYQSKKELLIPAITIYHQDCGYDDIIRSILNAPDFETELRRELGNKRIYAAANDNCKWFFPNEKPQNKQAKEIVKGIYMLIHKKEVLPSVFQWARITVKKGSLEKNDLLDAKQKQKWNIGRGINPEIDYDIHENDIAIKENEEDKEIYKINHSVSRKHAYIVFDPKEGFKIKPYTKIIVAEITKKPEKVVTSIKIKGAGDEIHRKVFVDKSEYPELLQNNDLIYVAEVILRFEHLTEEPMSAINTFTVTSVANNPAYGSVSSVGVKIVSGTEITVIAVAKPGHIFINWTIDDIEVSTNESYSFKVSKDVALVANFQLKTYNISVLTNPTKGGKVDGCGSYTHNSPVLVTAVPETGYAFVNWTKNGNEVSKKLNFQFDAIENVDLIANFVQKLAVENDLGI